MMNVGEFKKYVPLFFVLGMLILCGGFFIVSCGHGPQEKVATITGGAYGIDLSDCPAPGGRPCYAVIESDVFDKDPNKSMAGKELTAEAWVKIHGTSTASGYVFGRFSDAGIMLYLENDEPKVVARRVVYTVAPATGTSDIITDNGGTKLTRNVWYHIAGVLSFPNSGTTQELRLYVDGQLQNTNSNAIDPTEPKEFTEPFGQYMNAGTHLDGAPVTGVAKGTRLSATIDEVRLWGRARTQSEIQECMDEELGLNGGPCGRVTGDLIGYFRFNEGSHDIVSEWSGLGSGGKEYVDPSSSNDPPVEPWDSGWTSGAPISARD